MIISTYQPYFAPFPGFFSKALRSDILVLLDTVQFPQGTSWLTRNRLKNHQGTLRLSVPVWKKGLGLQKINEVRICHERPWQGKYLESLKMAYAKAPFIDDHLDLLEEIFSGKFKKLIDLNLRIIKYLIEYLQLSVKVCLLSQLGIDAKEPLLSVEICKKLEASHFLGQISARKYLDTNAFEKAGVQLEFFVFRPLVYPQLWGAFLPNLSTFDLVFNCGPKARDILKKA
ncbi:MAG: WbqC family protein [Thermodesulfobacteriota bacterium]|nr:WbqC family protein [Thermodesulfobacteriota bacterium]